MTAKKHLQRLILRLIHSPMGIIPWEWLAQLPSSLPFLLFPVRLEARYVTVRHVVRNLDIADAIDVSKMPSVSPFFDNIGFESDEAGVMTYEVPSVSLITGPFGSLGFFIETYVGWQNIKATKVASLLKGKMIIKK